MKTYAFDAEGRLAEIQYAVNSANTRPTANVVLSYEPVYGRLATVLDGTGTTAYSYIPFDVNDGILGDGALASETKIAGNAVQYTHSYTYDALGRQVSGPRQTSAQWDALGRLTNLNNGLGAFSYSYDDTNGPSGRLVNADALLTDATAAFRTSFTYQGAGTLRRLTGILHQSGQDTSSLSVFSQHNYTYDAQGRLATWQQWAAGAQRTWTLTNDSDDQLTGVEEKDGSDTVLGTFGFGYDAAGNRTGASRSIVADNTTVARAWSANGLNQHTQQTAGPENGTQFTYDADGNTLTDGTRSYQWDAENRLVGVSGAFGAVAWEYDAFNRRVKQHDTAPGDAEKVRDLIWEGLAIIESRDQTTGEVRRYYGNGEERVVSGNDVLRLYYTTDHLGSVREVVDSAGTVRARYDYDPWGRRSANQITIDSLDTGFGYTGHYTHEASGIVLAPYRGYDPTTGRCLSRDPIEEDGGLNLYQYVSNSPSNLADPLGLYITYRGGGSQKFWDNYRKNYDFMSKTPSGQKLLRVAECSDKNIEIGPELERPLPKNTGGMTWPWPDGTIKIELNSNNLWPTRTLAHEMQHAIEKAYGKPDPACIGVTNPNDSKQDDFENRGTRAANKVGTEGKDGYGELPPVIRPELG